jgi:hypothetical protein
MKIIIDNKLEWAHWRSYEKLPMTLNGHIISHEALPTNLCGPMNTRRKAAEDPQWAHYWARVNVPTTSNGPRHL